MRIIFLFVSNPASQMPKSVFVLNCLINTQLKAPVFLYKFSGFHLVLESEGCRDGRPVPERISRKEDERMKKRVPKTVSMISVILLSSYYEKEIYELVREAIARENTGDIGIYYIKNSAALSLAYGSSTPTLRPASSAHEGIIHHIPEKDNRNVSKQTETLQFSRWFGDWQNDPKNASKIVNEDGTPKIMYHGSPATFDTFDIKKAKYSGLYGRGFYFTESASAAAVYGGLYDVSVVFTEKLHFVLSFFTKLWYTRFCRKNDKLFVNVFRQ